MKNRLRGLWLPGLFVAVLVLLFGAGPAPGPGGGETGDSGIAPRAVRPLPFQRLARERGESLGAVISALIRKAIRAPAEVTYSAEFPVFKVREGAPPITPEMVEAAQEDA